MSNVINITTAHPLIKLLEDTKQSIMKGELSSCIFMMIDTEGTPLTAQLIDEDDTMLMVGLLENTKLTVIFGEEE